jgi:hypothetical protein
MKREPGYYWVKYMGEWWVARFYANGAPLMKNKGPMWVFASKGGWLYHEHEFEEIDERQIIRQP